MSILIVTGTPGTGKTTVARLISALYGFHYLDGNRIISKYHLSEGYDRKRNAKIVDARKFSSAALKEIRIPRKLSKERAGMVIDSHLSPYLPKKSVAACIVTRCSLKTLEKRLKKRKYPAEKVRENLDAEIFDLCLVEARERGHATIELDTTKGINRASLSRELKKYGIGRTRQKHRTQRHDGH
jgi:adenylate kinase